MKKTKELYSVWKVYNQDSDLPEKFLVVDNDTKEAINVMGDEPLANMMAKDLNSSSKIKKAK